MNIISVIVILFTNKKHHVISSSAHWLPQSTQDQLQTWRRRRADTGFYHPSQHESEGKYLDRFSDQGEILPLSDSVKTQRPTVGEEVSTKQFYTNLEHKILSLTGIITQNVETED